MGDRYSDLSSQGKSGYYMLGNLGQTEILCEQANYKLKDRINLQCQGGSSMKRLIDIGFQNENVTMADTEREVETCETYYKTGSYELNKSNSLVGILE